MLGVEALTSLNEIAAKATFGAKKKSIIRITILFMIIFISVGFPLHYVRQTKSKSYIIQDGIGSLSAVAFQYGNQTFNAGQPLWQTRTGDGVDGRVWTDFFVVQTPTDRFDFLDYWWNRNGGSIWHKISLM